MARLFRTVLILSVFLLTACAEQPVEKKPAAASNTVASAATPAATPKPASSSNVRLSEETGHSTGSSYYVQNRVLASGGVVSGALMGS